MMDTASDRLSSSQETNCELWKSPTPWRENGLLGLHTSELASEAQEASVSVQRPFKQASDSVKPVANTTCMPSLSVVGLAALE